MGPNAGTAASFVDKRPGTAPGTASCCTCLGDSPTPPVPVTPRQGESRYRPLRGKSVSSIRRKAFDVFQDDDARSRAGDQDGGRSGGLGFSLFRARSSSMSSPRNAGKGTGPGSAGGLGLSGMHQMPCDVPPLPPLPLTPVPVNVPKLRIEQSGATFPANGNKFHAFDFDIDTKNKAAAAAADDDEVKPPAPLKILASKAPPARRPPPLPPAEDNCENVPPPPPGLLRKTGWSTAPCSPRKCVAKTTPDHREAAKWAEEVARLEAETDRILAEQKKRDLVRLQAQLAATPIRPTKVSIFDKLIILSRGKKSHAAPSQPGTPTSLAPTIFSHDFNRSSSSSIDSAYSPDPMAFIDLGSKSAAPQTDAPTTAVNGGDRRVTVRCLSSTISLPVTIDTSVVDILYSSANLTTHQLDPATSLVVECYVPLNLERRLRRYERIRDVMNSWDRDVQNSLLILAPEDAQDDSDLDYGSVPRTQDAPAGFCVQIWHSSRPGKWTKRWITLLDSGQVFAAKKPEAKPSDKDSTALCHLSDFDIYTPTESTLRRHLKPPGRYCYAIKSQQKTIVFPDGENFVHYFSTDDVSLSRQFHNSVHGWRSWYLVNKQVDVQKKDKIDAPTSQSTIQKSKSVVKHGHMRLKLSIDETPYTIGAFEPLLDLERFNKPLEEFGKDFLAEEKPKPSPPPAAPAAPVARQPSRKSPGQKVLTKTSAQAPPMPIGQAQTHDQAFSAGGLLGAGYEKRKQALEIVTTEPPKQPEGPFTGGASLLNNITSPQEKNSPAPEAKSWFPSAEQHSARARYQAARSQSARNPNPNVRRPNTADSAAQARRERAHHQQQQPLINLNNNFPEPPQWHAKGGQGVRAPAGGPLINYATGGQMPGQMYRNDPPHRNDLQQRGLARSTTRVGNQQPPNQHSSFAGRPRSRSVAGGSSQSGPRRFHQDDRPPVPPLPNRSVRRDGPGAPPGAPNRGRDPRPQEPLVNRAR